MPDHELISLSAAAVACLIAAGTDLWKFKVYNALTLPALAGGLISSGLSGGWEGLAASGLGALTGFGLLAAFFAMGGVGAGDVKLLTALGAWLGPTLTLHVFLASAVVAGLYALILAAASGSLLASAGGLLQLAGRLRRLEFGPEAGEAIAAEAARGDRRRRLVPFAAMTCAGFFIVVLGLERIAP